MSINRDDSRTIEISALIKPMSSAKTNQKDPDRYIVAAHRAANNSNEHFEKIKRDTTKWTVQNYWLDRWMVIYSPNWRDVHVSLGQEETDRLILAYSTR